MSGGDVLAGAFVPLRRILFEACPVAVALVRADDDGLRYAVVNDAFAALLGRSAADLVERPVAEVVHADDVAALEPAAGGPGPHSAETVLRHAHAGGEARHLRVRTVGLDLEESAAPHYVCYATDISAVAEAAGQAEGLAVHDPLTGLLTRRGFELELQLAGEATGVLTFGLDGFAEINATYGGAAGDGVLRAVAELLRTHFAPPAVLARLGGDEFGVLMRTGEPGVAAYGVLDDLRDRLLTVGPDRIRVTASAGVRFWEAGGDPLADAALALGEAKQLGRDRLVIDKGDPGRPLDLRERQRMSDLTRQALAADELVMHEQPIVRLLDGGPGRSELLLRLRDHDGSLVTPSRFLPAAERSGQIRSIDRWVLGQAIDLLAARQAVGDDRRLHVNLSAASLVDADTVDGIVARLRAAPVDPAGITFEVTETAAVHSMPVAERLAKQLAELGCGFAVDDFGTGWSSFSYLRHLPVTVLKIDGSFIRGLRRSRRDRATVRAMVDIAREYRIETVAEAVEDVRTLELLTELGVDHGQGFYLGVPTPAAAAA